MGSGLGPSLGSPCEEPGPTEAACHAFGHWVGAMLFFRELSEKGSSQDLNCASMRCWHCREVAYPAVPQHRPLVEMALISWVPRKGPRFEDHRLRHWERLSQ